VKEIKEASKDLNITEKAIMDKWRRGYLTLFKIGNKLYLSQNGIESLKSYA
jgi:predicted DNA-binding protein YlxM (UPF0122 family)